VAEKTLLQQIREKELLLNIKIEDTRKEAEEIIVKARKESGEMIENSEKEGKEAAREYYEIEQEKITKEIEQLKKQGDLQVISEKEKGERNIKPAIEKIVKMVSME
jgi:vacuolar-type H+-ATPase subunit H